MVAMWSIAGWLLIACAIPGPPQPEITRLPPLPTGTILDPALGTPIAFDHLIERLAAVRIVYVGEQHINPAHHAVQLRIIQALSERWQDIQVGMEMFAHTYQSRLDQWSAGRWDWPAFLKEVHWYANWKFDDTLYRDILLFVQEQRLKLAGLNIPFDLPPKIAIGGIDRLLPRDRAMLPDHIDLSNTAHRAYLKEIYDLHAFPGRGDFEDFYAAQCAWEDGMAQAIAERLGSSRMVVLAGNGHIIHKFGIPDRAYNRTGAPFLTVYLTTASEKHDPGIADFIWITEPPPPKNPHP
jgi:uncharacterized iron-regulated protein